MDAETLDRVRSYWDMQLRLFGADPRRSEEAFADIVRRYSEPGRQYHTLTHIRDVLYASRIWLGPVTAPAVYLAGILHDVIYDTRAHDNEERSAEYLREVLKSLDVPREVREETARLILLTKAHEAPREDSQACALIDADLAIFTADEDRYDAYAAAIRREYDWVAEDDYRVGRAKVLKQFLARPRIYRNDVWHERWEPRARGNLMREIATLEGSR
jgi:predicted metal-dependent HD superfamily phosphohydrolase